MRRSFTLVELVMVVLIIGMLATMAIPRLSHAGDSAAEAVLVRDLQTVRHAIIHYAAEHNNAFPGPSADEAFKQLTQYSSLKGGSSVVGGGVYVLGPYLVRMPTIAVGPNAGSNTILVDNGNSPPVAKPISGDAWVYNANTGEFYANITDPNDLGALDADTSRLKVIATLMPGKKVTGGALTDLNK